MGLLRFAFPAAVLLAFLAVPASAIHVQPGPNGASVQFDHDGDNEWWVEVLTKASAGDAVVAMEARPESGTFRGLQAKGVVDGWTKWGPETAFRIPPGDRVQFRAHVHDGGSGAVATIDSCFFTHPAGVEQCAAPPPPPGPWQSTEIASMRPYGYGGDMAIADSDNNGRRDVLVARSHGLHRVEWTGTAWVLESIDDRLFDTMAAGDGDNDGRNEAYGMVVGAPGMDLVKYHKEAGVWQETHLLDFAETMAGDMTLGDIDGAAGRELYVGLVVTECDPDPNVPICTSTSPIYHVRHHVRDGGGFWAATRIATLNGHVDSMWVGDGDNNGRFELYVGHGTRHADRTTQVQSVNGQWVTTELQGSGSESGYSLVVAGDGDRDGRNEVYQVNWYGVFLKHTYSQTSGWSSQEMFGFDGMVSPEGHTVHPTSLHLGDADSDGSQELYLATDQGEVYQVRWSGSAWTSMRIAHPDDPFGRGKGGNGLVVVGDGDNDGRREAYATFAFRMPNTGEEGVDRVYKVAMATTQFDATFTGVRGNEWWIQANVAATGGTLAKVDVRLNGGEWKPLAKQSWGGWAASYRAVQGTVVQFRATSTTGATDLSDCYRWIPPPNTDAAKTSCTPPPPGFDATFTGAKGNEWWVQVTVSGNQPIAKVEARVNCGSTWVALTNHGWGWAKSFHVPNGSKVDFRATSGTGATDLSGGYIWPNATPTGACP
jgi:hypothetical protein